MLGFTACKASERGSPAALAAAGVCWQHSGRGAPSFTEGDILVTGGGGGRGVFFLSGVGESVLSVMDSQCDRL